MPRKQRFKPSRKPKPIPQNEDAMIGRLPSSAPSSDAHNDNVGERDTPPARDEESSIEPEHGQGSR